MEQIEVKDEDDEDEEDEEKENENEKKPKASFGSALASILDFDVEEEDPILSKSTVTKKRLQVNTPHPRFLECRPSNL